ncbi:NAD(P)/FAD-dependent oxidoreductase [Pseudoroseicyclus aestuarii]|uniref:Amine oxidase domain-containing protein n=1 Tax=Pseudoroseicyclus aestuarii TaxID=1795041 RepID=A0A318STZ3_9RHOB|nr:FAD-dependent oxidoreductase [Pseudoroseicyclus aestuarii]PYE84922.1 hypothetical protein DFP88_102726 [Pseudoroseicyclus aestuarii]
MTITRRRIAVIGSGISGLGAAWLLGRQHEVTLIEAEDRLGGHARTRMAGPRGDQPVDTGFIVFNRVTYPHLCALFDALEVPVEPAGMSFGASIGGGQIEYGLAGLGALLAQPRNMADPRFLWMLRDILRFNAMAAKAASDPAMTTGELIARLGLGARFRDHYLLPLTGAIWSAPLEGMLEFPAQALIRFLQNHGLMSLRGQHQWYTVTGGSRSYVARLEAALRAQGTSIRTGCPVASVRRGPGGAEVTMRGARETFDEVVFATHSDDTLALLSDPTPQERRVLGAIRYRPNDMVLHSDPSVMPRRRAVWSSWVYSQEGAQSSPRIGLTYWMNALQPWLTEPLFVTLNSQRPIRPELVWDRAVLRHPVFDSAALSAQREAAAMNGQGATWFCGAWMRYGFHEDGLASAHAVADGIAARRAAAPLAAE